MASFTGPTLVWSRCQTWPAAGFIPSGEGATPAIEKVGPVHAHAQVGNAAEGEKGQKTWDGEDLGYNGLLGTIGCPLEVPASAPVASSGWPSAA